MAKFARTFGMGVGDLRPELNHHILEEHTGDEIILTGNTGLRFFMYPLDQFGVVGTVKIEDGSVTVVDALIGHVKYTWAGTDTDTAGRYMGYFRVYWGASWTLPETVSSLEITIRNPWERIG